MTGFSRVWLLLVALVLSSLTLEAHAIAQVPRPLGDGNVFPHFCVSFSGKWRADDGKEYVMEQNGCEWLTIRWVSGEGDLSQRDWMTIVPDDKYREIVGGDALKVIQKHRWNSLHYGTAIRTYTRFSYPERVEHEEVVIEQVNRRLLLETTYLRTDFSHNSEQYRATGQRVFRRIED